MQSTQKMGGIGALIAAGTFVVGLAMFAAMLGNFVSATDPAAAVEFIADNQVALYLWNITIHIVFGIVLVPVVLAIRDRLHDARSPLARVAAVFGLIWSGVIIATGMITNIAYGTVTDLQATDPEMAATVWASLDAVANGLGGGNEVLGAVWVLGVSIVALRERLFARWTNYLGVVMGIAGLVTVIPPLEDVGAVFGLGLIVWFIAVGRTLLKDRATTRQPSDSQGPAPSLTV
ncbi:MAG: DUF4386 family protein [Acidimicrobiia bacterium]|nr:DUF4386 family protein [Acidimicrobiia bacterium]MDX2467587.1 DUF4386 family protein [Acidimicrobiia bacterium]